MQKASRTNARGYGDSIKHFLLNSCTLFSETVYLLDNGSETVAVNQYGQVCKATGVPVIKDHKGWAKRPTRFAVAGINNRVIYICMGKVEDTITGE